ncbi:hypothetical protein Dimus_003751, partial [Dionaea muscipula]
RVVKLLNHGFIFSNMHGKLLASTYRNQTCRTIELPSWRGVPVMISFTWISNFGDELKLLSSCISCIINRRTAWIYVWYSKADLHDNGIDLSSSFLNQTLGCFFEYTRRWLSISRLRDAASSWIQTVKKPCIYHASGMEVVTGHGKRWLQIRQMVIFLASSDEQTCVVKHHISSSHKAVAEKQTWSLILVEKQLQVMTVI